MILARTRRLAPALVAAFAASTLSAGSAGAQEPPTPARLAPAEGLVVLVEYEGVDGAPDAWRGTAAHAVLNATPTGVALASVARQVLDQLLKVGKARDKIRGDDVALIGDHLARRGFLLAVHGRGDRGLMVLPGLGVHGGRGRVGAILDAMIEATGRTAVRLEVRGRSIGQEPPPAPGEDPPAGQANAPDVLLTWWFEDDDLILTVAPRLAPAAEGRARPGDWVATVLDAADGRIATAAEHPGRRAALAEGRGVAGFAPNGLFVIEYARIVSDDLRELAEALKARGPDPAPLTPPPGGVAPPGGRKPEGERPGADEIRALGLDRLQRITGRWGFRGRALMTAVRFEAPAPRTGLMALLDQPRLGIDALPPIPPEAEGWAVGTLDPGPAYAALIDLGRAAAPGQVQTFDRDLADLEAQFLGVTGLRLREDLLAPLGPTWCGYTTRLSIRGAEPISVPTILAAVRDREALGRSLDRAAKQINAALAGTPPAGEAPALVFEPLPAPERGYRLASPGGFVPWIGPDVQPTVLLGRSWLVVAPNPALARAALLGEADRDARWAARGEVAATFASLPPGLTSLSVGSPAGSAWPEQLASLPLTAQYLGNLLGSLDPEAKPAEGPALLGLLGVPAPGAFRIRVAPDQVPRASEIRAHLFPSVLATVVDERGLLFLGTEALPFACIGNGAVKFTSDGKDPGRPIDLQKLFRR